MTSTPPPLRVFISYSRDDAARADEVAADLEGRGFEPLMDRRSLPFGEEWKAELGRLIATADAVAWLLSPASIGSQWCRWEIAEVERRAKKLVPVLLAPTPIAELPESIGRLQILPREGVFDPKLDAEKLAAALSADHGWLRGHTRIGDRARQWAGGGRPRDLLLRGEPLAEAELWRDARPSSGPALSEEMAEFLAASRRDSIRRGRNRLATLATVAVAGLVLLLGALWQWRAASEQRDLAEAQRKVAEEQRKVAESNAYAAASGFIAAADSVASQLKQFVGTNPEAAVRIMDALMAEQRRVLQFIGDNGAVVQAAARLRSSFGDALAAAGRKADAYAQYESACRDFRAALPHGNLVATQDLLTCALKQLGAVGPDSGDRKTATDQVVDAMRRLTAVAGSDRQAKRTVAVALGMIMGGMSVGDPSYDAVSGEVLSSFRQLAETAPAAEKSDAVRDYAIALQNYAETLLERERFSELPTQIDAMKRAIGDRPFGRDRYWNQLVFGMSRIETLSKCPEATVPGCLAAMVALIDIAKRQLDGDPRFRAAIDDFGMSIRMAARVYDINRQGAAPGFAEAKTPARGSLLAHFDRLAQIRPLSDQEQELQSAVRVE